MHPSVHQSHYLHIYIHIYIFIYVTHQQLPAPTYKQNLRVTLAEALDDEAGAKMAEELGIRADDEAEEAKVERLEYLRKIRLLFLQQNQQGVGSVDDGGLLLYLLACLKAEMLLDLDVDVVRQLDAVLSGELPKAKGWKRLRAQVEALARHPDVRLRVCVCWGVDSCVYVETWTLHVPIH